jgi:mannitol-specific phosphotransferase system IIBC component
LGPAFFANSWQKLEYFSTKVAIFVQLLLIAFIMSARIITKSDNLKKMRQQTDQRLKQQAAQKEQRQETEKKNENDDDKA